MPFHLHIVPTQIAFFFTDNRGVIFVIRLDPSKRHTLKKEKKKAVIFLSR